MKSRRLEGAPAVAPKVRKNPNLMKLWFWPFEAAQTAVRLMETAVATQSVLAVRLPIISAAASNPFSADHRELSLMVSEKVDAFGRSGRSVANASGVVQRAAAANARDFGRASGGSVLTPMDWLVIFERNILIATTLMSLPMQSLAPVHKGVTANAKRLRRA
jgi:hypothetical protein